MDLAPGTLVDGKYRIVRPIGRGGMGAVYEAENVRVHKSVAMKVLSAGAADDVVRRFEKEAQAAGRIGSEHIVEVHDLGTTASGDPYMVMEYLEGETLRARLHREKSLSVEAALPILVQLLEGLAAAHAAGIVHRDLKPENVYLVAQRGGLRDWVKILDFGISKFSTVSEDGMTKTGQVIGTPQYMAPEQIKAPQLVDGRTDLYAVGVIFYQLLTGQIPFKAKTYAELLFKIVYEPLPHPATIVPALDASFAGRAACEILLKAMARDPDHRYASAAALRDALLDLAQRIGAPVTGETASSTRAFLRATGHAMPAPVVGATDPARVAGAPWPFPGTPPPGAQPSSAEATSTPGAGSWPRAHATFDAAPAATQVLVPGATPQPGATPHPTSTSHAGGTPHPALHPGFGPPTPHPSFGGVPLATQAPPDPNAGRKVAVALAAGLLAVAIGVGGFALTSGDGGPAGAADPRAGATEPPAPAPDADEPPPTRDAPAAALAPDPDAETSAASPDPTAVVDARPEPSASAAVEAAPPPPTPARPPVPPGGAGAKPPPRPPPKPAPRPTSVLGY